MGNHRFRLSDMMPNAWFYKLKDMGGRTRKHNSSHPIKKKPPSTTTSQETHLSHPRYTYSFTESTGAERFYNSSKHSKSSETHFPDPPRRSSKRRANRRTIYKPSPKPVTSSSVSAGCSCHATLDSVQSPNFVSPNDSSTVSDIHDSLPSDSESDNFAAPDSFELPSCSSSCNCRVSSSTTDIIIDMNNETFTREGKKQDGFDTILQLHLPPILTKPLKSKMEHKANPLVRRSSANFTGVRLRANSPRLASRKIQVHARKSVSSRNRSFSGSFAVVKSSMDPQTDFRDSMVEMIVENNIRASKDLEDLLACYLSLNSNEFHGLIVKAFEQIWFDMADLRL